MGFEVDSDESTSEIYHMIESVFTVIFLIEVMIRFIGCPPDRPFYKDKNAWLLSIPTQTPDTWSCLKLL
eukprot:5795861-Amphidinium_carterae.1